MTQWIDRKEVMKAINGDREALLSAFLWHESPQGIEYWAKQKKGETPIDVDTLKAMIGESVIRLKVGEKFTRGDGLTWECLFTRGSEAWLTNDGRTAYVWNAKTGERLGLGSNHNIEFSVRRKGSVVYRNGEPQFDTWEEDEI